MTRCIRSRYILRRSRQGFRAAAGEQDETALGRLWAAAKADYEAMKRQSTVYELYGRKMKNVLVSRRGRPLPRRTGGAGTEGWGVVHPGVLQGVRGDMGTRGTRVGRVLQHTDAVGQAG